MRPGTPFVVFQRYHKMYKVVNFNIFLSIIGDVKKLGLQHRTWIKEYACSNEISNGRQSLVYYRRASHNLQVHILYCSHCFCHLFIFYLCFSCVPYANPDNCPLRKEGGVYPNCCLQPDCSRLQEDSPQGEWTNRASAMSITKAC